MKMFSPKEDIMFILSDQIFLSGKTLSNCMSAEGNCSYDDIQTSTFQN